MENKNVFTYKYSAVQKKQVESIRNKYLPREVSKMDRLRELDARVGAAGLWQSLAVGIVGALVFGVGLCFALGVFSGPVWLTLILSALGLCIMLPAYPIYKIIYNKTKNALTPEILRLSDEIMNQQ